MKNIVLYTLAFLFLGFNSSNAQTTGCGNATSSPNAPTITGLPASNQLVICPGGTAPALTAVSSPCFYTIPDGTPGTLDNINIPVTLPAGAVITDVDFSINLETSWARDPEIRLTAPNAATALIVDVTGTFPTSTSPPGTYNALQNFYFDDQSTGAAMTGWNTPIVAFTPASSTVDPLPLGPVPYNILNPVGTPLNTFTGLTTAQASGNWVVGVQDQFAGDFAVYYNTCITINYTVTTVTGTDQWAATFCGAPPPAIVWTTGATLATAEAGTVANSGNTFTPPTPPAGTTVDYSLHCPDATTDCNQIDFSVTTLNPLAPVTTAVTYCQGAVPIALASSTAAPTQTIPIQTSAAIAAIAATGAPAISAGTPVYYLQAVGGTPVAVPTPSTATVGTTTYYIAQSITANGVTCEGTRTALVVTVVGAPSITIGVPVCATGCPGSAAMPSVITTPAAPPAGYVFEYSVDGGSLGVLPATLAYGEHTVQVRLRNNTAGTPAFNCTTLGNIVTVVVHKTPIITSIPPICEGDPLIVNLDCAAATGMEWEYSLNNGATWCEPGSSANTINLVGLSPGTYQILVRSHDIATGVSSGLTSGCPSLMVAGAVAPRPDIVELENRCDRTVQIHMDCKAPTGYAWVYEVDGAPTVGSTSFTTENVLTAPLTVGNHTINVAIRCDACGAGGTPALVGTCTDNMTIDVFGTPTAAPTIASVCPNATATLNISSTNDQALIAITDYHIDWGDGTETNLDDQSAIPANPTHTYTQAGTYRIHLTVKNESATGVICQTNTHVDAVILSACSATCFTPGAFATTSNTPVCVEGTLNLTGGYTEDAATPHTYAWSGPNNYCATTEDATRSTVRVADAGDYTITITNANGCTATSSTTVVVNDPTVTALTPTSLSVCETSAEPIIATLPNPTVTPAAAQIGATKWFTNAALTIAYVPGTATHTLTSKCVADTKTLYAAVDIDCNSDGTADRLNVAAGSQVFTIYPKPLAPTTTTAGCSIIVCPACSSDIITATAATGGASTAQFASNLYTATAGDVAGTITLSVASGITGSTCAATVVSGVATPACGSICSVSWTSTTPATTTICSGNTVTITSVMSAATGFTISFTDTETNTNFGGVADELVTTTPALTNTGCDPQIHTINYSITCAATGTVIKTGALNITVNPAPTFTSAVNCTSSCVVNLSSTCPSATLTYATGAVTGGAAVADLSGSTYTTPLNGTAGTIMITPTNSTTGCVGTAVSVATPACPAVCTPGFGSWGN